MAMLKDLLVSGDSRITGNEAVTGSIAVGNSGTATPGNNKAVTGGTLYNASTALGTTITVSTSNAYGLALTMSINTGGASSISGGFTLFTSCNKTPSADAGNTKYTGSNGIIYIKYTGTSSSITVIPEWIIRNGNRNGDCAAYGTISGTTITIYVYFRCKKNDAPTVWNVRLKSNDSNYTSTPTWNSGTATNVYKEDFPSSVKYGITSGKVLISKWAGEDCSLEKDGHCMDTYEDDSLYTLGFSNTDSGTKGNLNYLCLFPEHNSKYTTYSYNNVSTTYGWPITSTSCVGRCTISRNSTSSGNAATDATTYWMDQTADLIYNVSGDTSKVLTFTRPGYVTGASSPNAGSVTWGDWRLVSKALDIYEYTTAPTAGVNRTINLPPANYYKITASTSTTSTSNYYSYYVLPDTSLLPPVFVLEMVGGQSNSTSGGQHYNVFRKLDGTDIVSRAYWPNSGQQRIYAVVGTKIFEIASAKGSGMSGSISASILGNIY